ncbi:hypothetical protein HGA91_04465 [candidate division WWE3 bacterium]|nr:hypothetical protein [candidate division WWE3 bacterium]
MGRGDNRILARSFTVIPPDTQPPTDVFILEPANGSTLGTGTHGVRISAKDTVGVTTVTLYLYTQPSMGASFLMNSLSVPLQSGTAQDGIWRTEIDPGQYGAGNYSIFKYQVIAKDAAGNSTTSGLQQYTLDRRDLPPSVVTINEPASGVTIIGEPHAVMIHAVDAQAVSYVTLYVYYPETTGGSDVMHVYNVPFHHGTAQDGYWRMEHYPFSNHAVPTTNMKFQARACDSANQCSFSGLNSGITLQR